MTLREDQQFQIDMENARHANQMAAEQKRTRLEAVRLAKETLIENARNKPIDDRDLTADEITAFANVLITYVND
jgi:hypothetical protein